MNEEQKVEDPSENIDRFSFKFKIDDYTSEDLRDLFLNKAKDSKWTIHVDNAFLDKFFKDNMKNISSDMEDLFNYCKISHAKRVFGRSLDLRYKLIKEDIEAGFKHFLQKKETDHIKVDFYGCPIYI